MFIDILEVFFGISALSLCVPSRTGSDVELRPFLLVDLVVTLFCFEKHIRDLTDIRENPAGVGKQQDSATVGFRK